MLHFSWHQCGLHGWHLWTKYASDVALLITFWVCSLWLGLESQKKPPSHLDLKTMIPQDKPYRVKVWLTSVYSLIWRSDFLLQMSKLDESTDVLKRHSPNSMETLTAYICFQILLMHVLLFSAPSPPSVFLICMHVLVSPVCLGSNQGRKKKQRVNVSICRKGF